MKDFDMYQALKGAPVVTRDGRRVRDIKYDMQMTDLFYPITITVEEAGGAVTVYKCNSYGRRYSERQTNDDLFLAE